jgi:predicted alpha/beta-fold hydrolase
VSAPIDLMATSARFMQPRNRLYHRWLLGRMKADALATPGLAPHWAAALARVRSTWDFDDLYVAPANGWSGAAEYYRVNSAARFLAAIRVPTLVIHALDDPWIPGAPYRAFDWAGNPALVPLLPARGGHVGFHGAGGVWHDRCLVRFFDALA